MNIRKIIASFLVILFTVIAIPTFLVFGLSRTFFEPTFYAGKTVVTPSYELVLNAIAYNIYNKSVLIQNHFKQSDVRKVVKETLQMSLFQTSMNELADDFHQIKTEPNHPLTLNLNPYKPNLQKVADRLAINIFQSLPVCKPDEQPQFNIEGIATCVPEGTNYEIAAGPLSKQLENSVLGALPDTIDLSLAKDEKGSVFTTILTIADQIKFGGIIALMVTIILIVFVLYRPFSLIVRYEGLAFLASGFIGFLITILMGQIPAWVIETYSSKNSHFIDVIGGQLIAANYIQQIFNVLTGEIQKISFAFLGLGAILLALYFFFLRPKVEGGDFEL